MTEYTTTAVRAKTEDRVLARIEVTGREIPGPVFPTDVSPAGETSRSEDALVRQIKTRGHAVPVGRTLEKLDAGLLVRVHALSERGVAHLYAEEGGIVLAMVGSTAGDRRRAVESLPKVPDRPLADRRVFGVLIDAGTGGHYSEEGGWCLSQHDRPNPEGVSEAAAERFKAARYYRPALSGAGLDAGAIRRCANPAPRALLAVVLRTGPDEAMALLALARIAVALLRRRVFRAGAPWDSRAERERMVVSGERVRREIIASRKGGEDIVVKPARELDAEREADGETHWTEDERFRRHLERRRASGRAAYDTARALHVRLCPGLERKLLHLLRRDGAKPEAEFVSRHRALADDAPDDPQGAVRAALRRLAEAGKVGRVRSRRTGEVFVAATEPLDEPRHRRDLNRLIRDDGYGIVNPWAATRGVVAEGDEAEWREGPDDFDEAGLRDLALGRLRATSTAEQPLHAAENVADEAALAEVQAIA